WRILRDRVRRRAVSQGRRPEPAALRRRRARALCLRQAGEARLAQLLPRARRGFGIAGSGARLGARGSGGRASFPQIDDCEMTYTVEQHIALKRVGAIAASPDGNWLAVSV